MRPDDAFPMPEDPDVTARQAENEDLKDDVARIQELIRETGVAGGTARIFCVRPGTAKQVYLGEMPVESFTLEGLKAAYGGGDYSIKLVSDGGKYAKTLKLSIDPRCVGAIDKPTQSQGMDPALAAVLARLQPPDTSKDTMMPLVTGMMAMMMESQRANMQILVAALTGRPVQQDANSKVFDVIMPLAVEALKPKGGASDLLEAFKVFKEISGGQTTPTEEKDDMLTRLLTVAGPVLGAFMNRGNSQPMTQVNPVPAQIPNPATSQPVDPMQEKVGRLLGKLKLVTPILVKAAARNAGYDSYLETLEDALSDDEHELLETALNQDNWMEILFGNAPEVVKYGTWFNEFRLAYLTQDEADPADAPAPEQGTPGLV